MSDSDKHIKKSIKESFDGVQRKAPVDLWTTISQVTNLTEDEFHIHNSFTNQTKTAPTETWSKVKKQLIIDEVWDRISAYEDRRKRKIIWWYVGSISIILLLSLTMLNLYSNKNTSKFIKNKERISNPKTTAMVNQTKSKILEVDTKKSLSKNNKANSIFSVIEAEKHYDINPIQAINTVTPIGNQINDSTTNGDSSGIENFSIDKIPLIKMTLVEDNRFSNLLSSSFDSLNRLPFHRFEIGLTAYLGNSWLFNNDVKNGLNRKSLIRNNFSTGYNIGSVITYNFNKKSGLELGYDFYSVHKQNYDFYDEGRLVHKAIHLKQQKISLSYQLRLDTFAKRAFIVKTGFFFSHSIKEQASIDGVKNSINSSFETFDYGLNLGAGVEYDFSKFKVEYGMKTNIGFHNLTAKTNNFPKKFDYATTFILGGYVSVRYLF